MRILKALFICCAFSFSGQEITALAESQTGTVTDNLFRELDYYDGLKAWDSGQRDQAVTIWLKVAKFGDSSAMLKLGQLFELGEAVPQQNMMAAYYYDLAAKYGSKLAIHKARRLHSILSSDQSSKVAKAVAAFTPDTKVEEQRNTPQLVTEAGFFSAARLGDVETVKVAIEAGMNVNKYKMPEKLSALMIAAAYGQLSVARLLLKAGADVNAVDSGNRTALHVAAYAGMGDVAEWLIENGAYATAATDSGTFPHDLAKRSGHVELGKRLELVYRKEITQIQSKLNILGYDVGSPDGIAGSKTRMQLAIFGNRFAFESQSGSQCEDLPEFTEDNLPNKGGCDIASPLFPHPTVAVIDALLSAKSTSSWGIIMKQQYRGDDGRWKDDISLLNVYNGTKESAMSEALRKCADDETRKCKVDVIVPSGACIAVSYRYVDSPIVGGIFADSVSARKDAFLKCSKTYKGCNDAASMWRSYFEVDTCVPAQDK